jgi:hypothetical protein
LLNIKVFLPGNYQTPDEVMTPVNQLSLPLAFEIITWNEYYASSKL